MDFKRDDSRDKVKSNVSTSKMCSQNYREMIENKTSAVNRRKESIVYVKCINKVYLKSTIQSFKFSGVGAIPTLGIKARCCSLNYLVRQKRISCKKKQI